MESRDDDMKDIFCKLTETNKDILILVAKSIKIAQETGSQNTQSANSFRKLESTVCNTEI